MNEHSIEIISRLLIESKILNQESLIDELANWVEQSTVDFLTHLVNNRVLRSDKANAIQVLFKNRLDVACDGGAAASEEAIGAAKTLIRSLANGALISNGGLMAEPSEQGATIVDTLFEHSADSNISVKPVGEEIGRYKVKQEHASGGLGEVFVADDLQLNREVALKRIKSNVAESKSMRRRFVLEAELTGNLEHPGVVPVYGFGQANDGRPFYAMRFIRGESLADAIEDFHLHHRVDSTGDSALRFRNLLQRLVAVCNTIHYAHTRGVLHRDIKPDNIMLGEFGETLVVDWGLAKLLDSDAVSHSDVSGALVPQSGGSQSKTRIGAVIGTPGYMSPMQAGGNHDSLRPQDDVFSLGATLFRLLTNKKPYEGKLVDIESADSALHSSSPRDENSDIPFPLDAICKKAISLEDADRYVSAKELAADLELYLADEPVSAWKEPLSVRMLRWVRRHRTLVTSLSAALVVATIGLATASILLDQSRRRELDAKLEITEKNERIVEQQGKLVQESERAEANLVHARHAIDEWYTLIADSDQLKRTPRTDKFRKSLLKKASEYYEEFLVQASDDADVQHESALAAIRLGTITRELDPGEKALAYYEQAIEGLSRLNARFPREPEYLSDLYDAVNGQSIVLSRHLDKIDLALAASGELNRIANEMVELEPGNWANLKAVISAQQNTAGILMKAGKSSEALETYLQLEPKARELVERYHDDLDTKANLAAILYNRGSIYSLQLKNELARDDLESSIQLWNEVLEIEDSVESRFELANTATNLGLLYTRLKQPDKAMDAHQLVIDNAGKLADQHPDIASYSHLLSKGIANRAQLIQASGKIADARTELERALTVLEQLASRNPDVDEYVSDAATIQFNLAFALADSGNGEAALELFSEAGQKFGVLFEKNPGIIKHQMRLAVAQIQLAQQHMSLHQNELAHPPASGAVKNGEELVKRAPDAIQYLQILSSALNVQGRLFAEIEDRTSAESVFKRAIEIRSKILDLNPDSPSSKLQLANVYYNFAIFYDRDEDKSKVVKNMEAASVIFEELQTLGIPLPPRIISTMAIVEYFIAKYSDDDARMLLLKKAILGLESALEGSPGNQRLTAYLADAKEEFELNDASGDD